jgi:hypothetical protein
MSTPMITIKIEAIEFINKGIEEDLRNFVEREILSTETDRNRLEKIIIRELGDYSDTYGYWEPAFVYQQDNPDIIVDIKAIIVLNASKLTTVESLKETLAHEYGHHWTLSYLAVNQQLNIFEERLPNTYYKYRKLRKNYCVYHVKKCNQPSLWHRCDKEIIAEDYRVLFTPYNQNHETITRTKEEIALEQHNMNVFARSRYLFNKLFDLISPNGSLLHPNEVTRQYIENLCN